MTLESSIKFEYDVPIEASDGVKLRANVYRPAKPGRYPVLVNMGPYGKDVSFGQVYSTMWRSMVKENPEIVAGGDEDHIKWEVPDPQRWVPEGYVVVHADTRGTGRSPGVWDPLSKRERMDACELVDWAGTQEWSSGKVAVVGVSYYAVTAWLTAAEQPKHLAAIIPFNGWADVYREFGRHGGIVSQFLEHWWNRWLINQHGHPEGRIGVISGERTTGPELLSDEERAKMRVDMPLQLIEHETYDDWYKERSVDWSAVTVPFLSITTWGTVGLHLRGNVDAFCFAASKEKWLLALPGDLGRTEDFHKDDALLMQRQFLARYLKGDQAAWKPEADVVVHAMTATGKPAKLRGSSWPLPGTNFKKICLDCGSRTLVDRPGADAKMTYQAFSQGATLASAPFDAEATIAGPIAAKLWVSTEAPDMDVFVELRVIGADGILVNYLNPTQVITSGTTPGMPAARGWLRLSQRELDPTRTLPERPVHAHKGVSEVVRGEVYEIDVEIWPTAFVVPKGARLTVTVHGEDDPQTELIRHHHPEDRTWPRFRGLNTVYSGPERPSHLLIPFVSA